MMSPTAECEEETGFRAKYHVSNEKPRRLKLTIELGVDVDRMSSTSTTVTSALLRLLSDAYFRDGAIPKTSERRLTVDARFGRSEEVDVKINWEMVEK
jgi:8-oxo-dGTP pyrophosphatase MutT (NUDIX family)